MINEGNIKVAKNFNKILNDLVDVSVLSIVRALNFVAVQPIIKCSNFYNCLISFLDFDVLFLFINILNKVLQYKKERSEDDMNMKILENIIQIIFSFVVIFGGPLFVIYFSDIISNKVIKNLELKNIKKEKLKKIIYANNLRFITYAFIIISLMTLTYLKILHFLIGIWICIFFICLCMINKKLGDALNDYLEKILLKEKN